MQETKDYTITLDDDSMIFRIIEKMTGIKSLPFTSAEKLLNRAESYAPIAAFIDVNLGVDECGLDIIPKLRQMWPLSPIIVVTADAKADLVGQALASGANDFIRKPLNADELKGRLFARISELRERHKDSVRTVGDIQFNYKMRMVEGHGRKAYLSPIEAELLLAMCESNGMILSREVIKRRLWGDVKVTDNALDRRISELRKNLKDVTIQVRIRSIYGSGVILEHEASELKKVG